MSHAKVTTWTCDRCGRSLSLEHGEQPEGWRLVELSLLDDSATPAAQGWEICSACANQVERFMMNGAEVLPAAITSPQAA